MEMSIPGTEHAKKEVANRKDDKRCMGESTAVTKGGELEQDGTA